MLDDKKIDVLLVDDEPASLMVHESWVQSYGFGVCATESAEDALNHLEHNRFDVVLTDMRMPGLSGKELLLRLGDEGYYGEVVIVSAYGTIETATDAIRAGAFNFLVKPLKKDALRLEIEKAARSGKLRYENFLYKQEGSRRQDNVYEFKSSSIKNMYSQLDKVAATDSAILLMGESGVGKEVAAKYIYENSKRSDGRFVPVHCASLASGVLESELFGHEKGAFTGAGKQRLGRFELAKGGTIFLDEISSIPLSTQVKLLRVLQEKSITRVGGSSPVAVDFRLISASNEDLRKLVEQGRFREDLYYRVGVIPISIPPLRDAEQDISSLAYYFLRQFAARQSKGDMTFADHALDEMVSYNWPGNVRELRNVVERAVALASESTIRRLYLSEPQLSSQQDMSDAGGEIQMELKSAVEKFEKQHLRGALATGSWNVTNVAKMVGMSRRNLQLKIKKYGLKKI